MTSTIARETQAETRGITTWVFNPAHTLIEFSGKHMMFTTVKGRFNAFQGTISIDDEQPTRSSVEVAIDAASLDTRTEMRDNHLRSADFLDVENHPTITFKSTRIGLPAGAQMRPGLEFKVYGDLTIRGTTREVVLDTIWNGEDVDPYGQRVTGFSASTKIKRKDFGLTWNVALESGGWLVGEEIKIELEVQANPMP